MKPKYIFMFVLVIANVLMLCLAPRFGWNLRSGVPLNIYKFQDSRIVDKQIVAVYGLSNSVLEVGYGNRFSRNLKIQLDGGGTYDIRVNIDGGIDGLPLWPQQSVFDAVLSDIIWKDSSGIFYYRYILVGGAMFGYILCFIKAKPTSKTLYLSGGFILFILSALLSLRVII